MPGPFELIIILVIVLLIFGGKRLKNIGNEVGGAIKGFKSSMKDTDAEKKEDIIEAKLLPQGKAQDLRDALEYIAMMRIRHQAWQIEKGEEPDNDLDPHLLSPFEQRNLKEAFAILEKAQSYLKFSYTANSGVK